MSWRFIVVALLLMVARPAFALTLTDAEAAESKTVPARKQFIANSAKLFQRDAALVRKQHCLSPSFAANKKKQLQQNYDLFLQQTPN